MMIGQNQFNFNFFLEISHQFLKKGSFCQQIQIFLTQNKQSNIIRLYFIQQ
ncbi:hypothetical protein pb186bvf_003909 [Paramecium bursaria]